MPDRNDDAAVLDDTTLALLRTLLKTGRDDEIAALLGRMHAGDLADLLTDFDEGETVRLFGLLDPEAAADVLAEVDAETREDLVDALPQAEFHDLLGELEPDDAADIIGELEPDEALAALAALEDRHEVATLLEYAPESAGGLMTTEMVALPRDLTVAEALERTRGASETTHRDVLYVTNDSGRPVGLLPLAKLVFSPPEARIVTLMEPDVRTVPTDMDQEEVAEIVRRYDLISVPVIRPDTGRLAGIITVDDIMDAVADEAAEDLYRLAGSGASDPFHQSVWKRALLRLPWLIITLGPGFLVGQIMRWLGYDPGGTTALLLFVPVMIEMAGSVSLQSATVIVRGLATGDVRSHRTLAILGREVAVAILVGLVCATIAGLVGYAFFGGSWPFAACVAASMVCGVLTAAVTGTLVPLGCHAVGVDPALASGPFVTSLNDVTGTLIYLGLGAGLLRALGG